MPGRPVTPATDRPPELPGQKPGDRRVRVERATRRTSATRAAACSTARAAASTPTTAAADALGARQVDPHRPAAGHRRGDRGAALEEEGAGHLQLGRHQLERLRDRGDPARPRRRPARPRSSSASRSPSPSPSCWRSSPPATARSATPTPTAAAPTRWPARTSAASFALVAAAALLVDYILTVAVSTSSAVEQITSAIPVLRPEAVPHRASSPSSSSRSATCAACASRATSSPSRPTSSSARALLMIGIGVYRVARARRGRAAQGPIVEGSDRPDPGGRHPAPAARLRRRLGGADRHRGHRQRRAGLQAAGAAATRPRR